MSATAAPERLGPPPGVAGYRLLNLLEPPRPRRIAESARGPLLVVITVCVGAFMGQLDSGIVSVALPRMSEQLHVGVNAAEWVSLSYIFTLVALIVPIGAWADTVGRKSLYVGGFAVFTAASAACAIAPGVAVLCGLRVLQAIGAALMQANSVALIASAVPRERLGRMVGLQAAAQAIGLAAGPAIGGVLLTATGSWRWLFLVNVPAGLFGVAIAATLLPRSRDLSDSREFGGGALGRHLVGLLRAPRLAATLIASLSGYALLFGTLVAIPLYLHHGGASTVATGLIIATLPLAMGVVAPIAGHLSDRAPHRVATAGLAFAVVALVATAVVRPTGTGLVALLVGVGVGLGTFTPANNRSVMIAAPPGASSTAAGLLNMMRGLGTAAGTALAVTLLG